MNNYPEKTDKSYLSFQNIVVLTIIFILFYVLLLNFVNFDENLSMLFSDVSSPLIEIIVISALFYAAKHSKVQGRRVQIVWMLIALSVLLYFMGDVIWGVLEIGLNQSPFPSVADGNHNILTWNK